MLVEIFFALAVFAASCFWVVRFSDRMRSELERRHPELLARYAPAADAAPWEHMEWHSTFNIVWKLLPLIEGLDDTHLARDARRLYLALAATLVSWLTMVISFVLWVSAGR